METLSLSHVQDKPQGCLSCPYNGVGAGFVPDWVPPNPKIAFLLEAAGDDEKDARQPLVGATGKIFNHYLWNCGWSRSDVLIANVIHCHPPGNNYPTGELRRIAERKCSQYHGIQGVPAIGGVSLTTGGLWSFNPDYFLFTFHPASVIRTWTLVRLHHPPFESQENDFQKAKRLSQDHRLLVIMGEKAKSFVFPDQYQGGIMKWRGHHGALDREKFKTQYRS